MIISSTQKPDAPHRATAETGTETLTFAAPVIGTSRGSILIPRPIVGLSDKFSLEPIRPLGSLAFDVSETVEAIEDGALDKFAGGFGSVLKAVGGGVQVTTPLSLIEATGAFARSDGDSLLPAGAKLVKAAGSTLDAFGVPHADVVGQVSGIAGAGIKAWIELADGEHTVSDGIAVVSFVGKAAGLIHKLGVGPAMLGTIAEVVSELAPLASEVLTAAEVADELPSWA